MSVALEKAILSGKKTLCCPWTPWVGSGDLHYDRGWNLYTFDDCWLLSVVTEVLSSTYFSYAITTSGHFAIDFNFDQRYPTFEAAHLAVEKNFNLRILSEEEYQRLDAMR